MVLLESPNLYFYVSFLGFLVLIYRYAYRPFISLLDAYIAKIEHTLKLAEDQKQAITESLQQENTRLQQIDQEMVDILNVAKQQCESLRYNIGAEILEKTLEQEHQLKRLMKKMNQDFICQLNDQITDKIIHSLKEWVETHQESDVQESFQKQAIFLLQNLKLTNKN